MRLRRLDLIRYGHFTDFTIDFGARRETEIDLHIIYGPNEAGKSTSFEGFLDLLFGIPNRSRYNFLHDYENMRIGGALDIGGETVELIRIKKSKNDLINPAGETVPSGILASGLRGIDRDQYRAMFSLDDDTIEAGGDDILASQGDLGELLFSAAAGLTDLGSVLEDARLEIDAFSKKRARKTDLAELKRNLKDINEEIRSVDVPASTYRNLKERKDSASKLLSSSKMQRDELISQKLKIQTIIDCLEPFDTLRRHQAELAEVELYPTVPEAHLNTAENLRISLVKEQANLRNGENQKSIEDDKLRDTKLDEVIVSEQEVLNFLLDVPKARAQTALEDIPKRELELSSLTDEIDDLLAGLDLTANDFEQINEIVLAELEELASEYRSEINQLSNSRKEMSVALEAFEDLQQANIVHDSSVAEPHPIELLFKDVDPNHLLISKDMNSKALDEITGSLDGAVYALVPWTGSKEFLNTVQLSENEANRLASNYADLLDAQKKAKASVDEAEANYNAVHARLDSIKASEIFDLTNNAKEIKENRDTLWFTHIKSLSLSTATEFEQSMREFDLIQDSRILASENLARLRELEAEVSAAEALMKTRKQQLSKATEEFEKNQSKMADLFSKLYLPEHFDPRDLPAWQTKFQNAQRIKLELKIKIDAFEVIEAEVKRVSNLLAGALGVDNEEDLRSLNDLAINTIDSLTKSKAQYEEHQNSVERAQKSVKSRGVKVSEYENKIEETQTRWGVATKPLPDGIGNIYNFNIKLQILRQILVKKNEKIKIIRRISAMENDRDKFADQVRDLSSKVNERNVDEPLIAAQKLQNRLTAALVTNERAKGIDEKIKEAENIISDANSAIQELENKLNELSEPYQNVVEINNIDELIDAIQISQKASTLRNEITRLEQLILDRLICESMSDAEDILTANNLIELQSQLVSISSDLEDAETDYGTKIGDLRTANDALETVGGDSLPAELEEKRQTLLADLAEKTKKALSLRLGVMAARQSIANYREQHKSGMLFETEIAFRALTSGKYSALRTQTNGNNEILLAMRESDKRSVAVSEMSKGTRFQLYLALRVAGYKQYVSDDMILPFVADDIMETFDNHRTLAALRLMGEISNTGQALYFTHHEHVVGIAKDLFGDAIKVHDLRT
jgi:uncharacterized protein YhaN